MALSFNKKTKIKKKYLRMTLNERIQHIFLFLSFFTLVITGFGLKYPEAFWVKWIVAIIGENAFELRGVVHRVAAATMIMVALYHIFYIMFTKRGRQVIKELWFSKKDFKDIFIMIKFFIGKSSQKPKFGKFSYIEKTEYWAVVWGTIIMGVTGILLWFENQFLPIIGLTGMYIATIIHWYEAILASLAILMWHFYYVFINPDVFPMNRSWINGYLTEEEMKKEHPLEINGIENEKLTNPENDIK